MNCGGVRQVQRMVGQALWSGPEENLFMTNWLFLPFFVVFLAIVTSTLFLFLLNLHTLTSRCCVYIYG